MKMFMYDSLSFISFLFLIIKNIFNIYQIKRILANFNENKNYTIIIGGTPAWKK
jgi:hypothetical protein